MLVVVDRDVGPDPPHQPHQRPRLRLGGRARGPGSRCRTRRPPPRQRRGKLRLRSTPRAFWRVPRATPSGLSVRTVHTCTPAGGRGPPQPPRSPRGPAGSVPWIEPVTSTRTGASRRPAPDGDDRRPAHGAARVDPRRQRARRGEHRGGEPARRPPRGTCHRMHTVIVGAGTFGASLAWTLARAGARSRSSTSSSRATARASSGGESRLIRCSHGADARLHAYGAARAGAVARARGRERARTYGRVRHGLVRPARGRLGGGVRARDDARRASRRAARPRRGGEAVPEPRRDDLAFVLYEPEAGVRARAARGAGARAAGRRARRADRARARRARTAGGALLEDGTRLEGDAVVWACGGWLGGLFPATSSAARHLPGAAVLRRRAGLARPAPGWVDYDRAMYGTGDLDELGVKAALDVEGPPLDPDAELPAAGATEAPCARTSPTASPRSPTRRCKEGRCCRYELSPDSNFIAAPHPSLERDVDRRRRLGPRLQARPGDRRA